MNWHAALLASMDPGHSAACQLGLGGQVGVLGGPSIDWCRCVLCIHKDLAFNSLQLPTFSPRCPTLPSCLC